MMVNGQLNMVPFNLCTGNSKNWEVRLFGIGLWPKYGDKDAKIAVLSEMQFCIIMRHKDSLT